MNVLSPSSIYEATVADPRIWHWQRPKCTSRKSQMVLRTSKPDYPGERQNRPHHEQDRRTTAAGKDRGSLVHVRSGRGLQKLHAIAHLFGRHDLPHEPKHRNDLADTAGLRGTVGNARMRQALRVEA